MPTFAFRRRPGREEWYGDQFRAAHFSPARLLYSPGEARADWWIIAQMAKQLGYAGAFSWQNAWEVFCEHAALSGFENNGERAFDIGAPPK